MLKLFRNLLTDWLVEKLYVRAGGIFGDAVSYLYIGECAGFEDLLNRWAKWEKEYARRGYKTLSLDDFIDYGGYGKPLEGLGVKIEPGQLVLHAEIYRQHYLGKTEPIADWKKVMDGGCYVVVTYALPSTEETQGGKE